MKFLVKGIELNSDLAEIKAVEDDVRVGEGWTICNECMVRMLIFIRGQVEEKVEEFCLVRITDVTRENDIPQKIHRIHQERRILPENFLDFDSLLNNVSPLKTAREILWDLGIVDEAIFIENKIQQKYIFNSSRIGEKEEGDAYFLIERVGSENVLYCFFEVDCLVSHDKLEKIRENSNLQLVPLEKCLVPFISIPCILSFDKNGNASNRYLSAKFSGLNREETYKEEQEQKKKDNERKFPLSAYSAKSIFGGTIMR